MLCDVDTDTGRDTGKETGKERPDIYVLKLIKVVGDKTLTVKDMMAMLQLKGSDNFRKKIFESGYWKWIYDTDLS